MVCGLMNSFRASMAGITHTGAQHFASMLRSGLLSLQKDTGLVIGYGKGHEASFLSRCLGITVCGIDLHPPVDMYREYFVPILADALHIPFPSNRFGFVFCYHVLEHLSDPGAGLAEIYRVLRPGGCLYIGTPNRHRVVGYIGSYGTTLRQKVVWNLKDYVDRLRGKFSNDVGAHAGFSQQELQKLLAEHFADIHWLTKEYLWFKYSGKMPAPILRALLADPMLKYIAPAIYALCRK